MKPVLLPPDLLANLDLVVMERQGNHEFKLIGEAPAWLRKLNPETPAAGKVWKPGDRFYYLAHFLEEAEEFWVQGQAGQIKSEIWTEEGPDGREWLLEAIALYLDGQCLLLLKFPSSDFKTLRSVYQEARDQNLKHFDLLKEIDKREITLHCTVHDLSAPLAGIRASLWLLKEDDMVKPVGEEFLTIGLDQVDKMQDLIKDTLTNFSTRSKPLLQQATSLDEFPNVLRSIEEVTDALNAMASTKEVRFRISREGPDDTDWRVNGDLARLERVLFNLLENALRHTHTGTVIGVRLRDEGNFIRVSIKDSGDGVPAEVLPKLFQKFSQGGGNDGQAGLGLYFSRITVEEWGGEIGCLPEMKGGACFWFKLPKAGQNGQSS